MGIVRLNELPEGSGNLTSDDIFVFMDDPSGSGITKKISLSQISDAIGGGDQIMAAPEWTANHSYIEGDEDSRYLAGDVVYHSGNIYKALLDNESLNPGTSPIYWELIGPGFRINIDGRDIDRIPYPQLISVMNGRLSLSSTESYSNSDILAASTLYYHPYNGNMISLYNTITSSWQYYTLSSALSLNLSGVVADTNYDIFLYDNGGTLSLESVAWSNSNAGTSSRSAALATKDGVFVKSGQLNKRYIGSIRASANNQCEDSSSKRFLWNYYNKIYRKTNAGDSTNHDYEGTARPWNNNTNYGETRIGFIVGFPDLITIHQNNASNFGDTEHPSGQSQVGIGLNTTSSFSCQCLISSTRLDVTMRYGTSSSISIPTGFNFIQGLESTANDGSGSFQDLEIVSTIWC